MWALDSPGSNTTNKVVIPTGGIISVSKPDSVTVYPYVNDSTAATPHIHVAEGDTVYFKLLGTSDTPVTVSFDYNGVTSTVEVPAANTSALFGAYSTKENIMTGSEAINLFANPNNGGNMGGAGAGLGAGLLGGIIGGTILNNRGGLGDNVGGIVTPTMLTAALGQVQDNTNAAVAASERLNMARFDADSQREIQATIERTAAATQLANAVQTGALGVSVIKGQGEITTQVALTTGSLNTQNALNSAATQTLVQKVGGDLGVQVALGQSALGMAIERNAAASALAFKDSAILALQNSNSLDNAIKADGDQTRALIVAQNDAALNRMLTTAQAEIIELRGDRTASLRSREVEVNVTQSVNQNQMQLQAQQQQQQQAVLNAQIVSALHGLQVATATNQQLIIGNSGITTGGPQTANPVNVRA